jgi:hypothetical protein
MGQVFIVKLQDRLTLRNRDKNRRCAKEKLRPIVDNRSPLVRSVVHEANVDIFARLYRHLKA